MLTLYHVDSAVCAAKVRLVLAEKSLSYESKLVDLSKGEQFDPAYMKLNPNAVVPTLVNDVDVVTESTVINEYLDEMFPTPALRPETAYGRAKMRLWTKQEDSTHDAINTMTAVLIFRPPLLEKSPEERARRYSKMPDPARREKWRAMIEMGLDSPQVREALVRFEILFRKMEASLQTTPWLLGSAFTLADAGLVSFIYRLELLQLDCLWDPKFPRVAAWFQKCKERKSVIQSIIAPIPLPFRTHYENLAAPHREMLMALYNEAAMTI